MDASDRGRLMNKLADLMERDRQILAVSWATSYWLLGFPRVCSSKDSRPIPVVVATVFLIWPPVLSYAHLVTCLSCSPWRRWTMENHTTSPSWVTFSSLLTATGKRHRIRPRRLKRVTLFNLLDTTKWCIRFHICPAVKGNMFAPHADFAWWPQKFTGKKKGHAKEGLLVIHRVQNIKASNSLYSNTIVYVSKAVPPLRPTGCIHDYYRVY